MLKPRRAPRDKPGLNLALSGSVSESFPHEALSKEKRKMGLEGENGKHQTQGNYKKWLKKEGGDRLARYKQEIRKKTEVGP